MATVTETIGAFRRNLLLESRDLNVSPWTKTNVSVDTDVETDPDGGTTADRVNDTSAGAYGDVRQSTSGTLTHNAIHTGSVCFKEDTATSFRIIFQTDTSAISTNIDVAWTAGVPSISGTGQTGAGVHTYAIRPYVGADETVTGWYRAELQVTYDNTGAPNLRLICQPDRESTASQNATFFWGAQIEERATASAIQHQGAADVYTGDYASITAWETAHSDPVGDTNIYVGQLLDGAHTIDANSLVIDNADGNTSASYYRKLTYATTRYTPHDHTGPRIYVQWLDSTAAQIGVEVVEDFFQIEGVGIICENPRGNAATGGNIWAGLRVKGNDFLANALFVKAAESKDQYTTAYNFYCIHVENTSGDEAKRAQFFNSLVMGGRNGRGAGIGFHYGSFSQNGGCYGCGSYRITNGPSPRGFLANVASVSVAPERINCWSIGTVGSTLGPTGGQDYSGLWARYGYCISSDDTALDGFSGGTRYAKDPVTGAESTITGGGGTDEWSHAYISESQFILPGAQDFRVLAQSIAFGQGRAAESALFVSNIGAAEDYIEDARGTTNWSIGPFENIGTRAVRAVEIIQYVSNATEGMHFANLKDWAEATEDTSLRSEGRKYTAQVFRGDGSNYTLPSAETLKFYRTISASGYFRKVTADDTWQFDPTEQIGAEISGEVDADYKCTVYIGEEFFFFEGHNIIQTSTASERYTLKAEGYRSAVNATAVRDLSGTPTTSANLLVRADGFEARNVLAIGGNTTGAQYGIRIEHCNRPYLLHCIAAVHKQGAGVGIRQDTGAVNATIDGCIAIFNATDFSGVDLKGVLGASISQDATAANYPLSLGSQDPNDIFVAWGSQDFRLIPNSIALKKGRNWGAKFSTDFAGNTRYAPFDIGIFEGVGPQGLVYGPAPTLNKFSMFLCKLIKIVRKDGTGYFFTDSSLSITYRGNTYKPQDGVDASARENRSGLGESSVEYRGLVNDSTIKATDLAAGLFRDARVTEYTIDFRYPWTAPIDEVQYTLGPGSFDGETWQTDALGLGYVLEQAVGATRSTTCRARFGDERCGVDLTSVTVENVDVFSLATDSRRNFYADQTSLGTFADGYFEAGEITWLSGSNANTTQTIKRSDQGNGTSSLFILFEETPFPIKTTDTFRVVAGCKKRYIEDCITKHNNGKRFRAEPFMLGGDDLFDTLAVWNRNNT